MRYRRNVPRQRLSVTSPQLTLLSSESFPTKTRLRRRCLLLPLLCNTVEVLARPISQEKGRKSIQTGKEEVKLPVSKRHDHTQEKPEDSAKKLLELICKFSEVARYKINTQKSISFLHANNKLSETEIKKTVQFTMASKTIKYSGGKHLHTHSYKTSVKEPEEDTNDRLSHVCRSEEFMLLKCPHY